MRAQSAGASPPVRVEFQVHSKDGRNGQKELREGGAPEPPVERGSVPRVARLPALAYHFDGFLRESGVQSYSELAALTHVSRARITQRTRTAPGTYPELNTKLETVLMGARIAPTR